MNWFLKFFKKKDKFIYPCTGCIVLPGGCKQLCDKVEMDDDKLVNHGGENLACPDCGSTEWYEGPSGGMSTNLKCAQCNHYFNYTPLVNGIFERIRVGENGVIDHR